MDFDPNKLLTAPLFAGVMGSLIALRFAPGVSWSERFTNVASGSACAGFIAPAMGEYFHLGTASMLSFLSFALGLFGMSIAAAVMSGIKDLKVGEIVSGWISKGGPR